MKVYDEKTGGTLPVTPSSSATEVKLAEMNTYIIRTQPHSIRWDRAPCFVFVLVHKGDKHTASKELMHTLKRKTIFWFVTQGRQTYFK